ncbi:MAG: hypothetical protein PHE55_12175 [Methylococcaceae bacterium]|nr:hypothetical protein [Methylococcaceae bacterium]
MKTKHPFEPAVFVNFGETEDLTWWQPAPVLFDFSQCQNLLADFLTIPADRVDSNDEKLFLDFSRQQVFSPKNDENGLMARVRQPY